MTTTGDKRSSPLLDRLGDEVKGSYEKSRKLLDSATSLRADFEKLETPVRDAEDRVRSKAAKGRRFKTLFSDLKVAVGRAVELQEKLHQKEWAALLELRGLVEKVREIAESSELDVPPRTLEGLEQVVRLRASEVEWLDGAIRHSRRIVDLGPETTPDEVAPVLEQRRVYVDSIGSARAEATALERAALGLPRRTSGTDGHGGRAWEAWLIGAESACGNGRPQTTVSKALIRRFELLQDELAGLRRLAVRERDELARSSAERIRDIETGHAEALASETRSRREAEGRIEEHVRERDALAARVEEYEKIREELLARRKELELEIEQRNKELEHSKLEFESRERELQSASKKIANKAADTEAELLIRVKELEQERDRLVESVADAEQAAAKAKGTLRAKEEELERDRGEIAKERAELAERAEGAVRERDEALILINSLMKRLGVPDSSENRTS